MLTDPFVPSTWLAIGVVSVLTTVLLAVVLRYEDDAPAPGGGGPVAEALLVLVGLITDQGALQAMPNFAPTRCRVPLDEGKYQPVVTPLRTRCPGRERHRQRAGVGALRAAGRHAASHHPAELLLVSHRHLPAHPHPAHHPHGAGPERQPARTRRRGPGLV